MRKLSYNLVFSLESFKAADPEVAAHLPDRFGILAVSFDVSRNEPPNTAADRYWKCVERVEALGDKIIDPRRTTDEGLQICLFPPDDLAKPHRRWTLYAIADSEVYTFADGQVFSMRCTAEGMSRKRRCSVQYRLSPSILLSYDFDDKRIPVDYVILLDQTVRAWIKTVTVKNYPWAAPMIPRPLP